MSNASEAFEPHGIVDDINREVVEFWQRIRQQIEDYFVEIGAAEGNITKGFAPFRFIRRVWPAEGLPAFSYTHYDPAKVNAIVSNGGIAGTLYDEVERHDRLFNGLERSTLHAYVVRTVAASEGLALPDAEIWPVCLSDEQILTEPRIIPQQPLINGGVSRDIAGGHPNSVLFWLPVYEFMRDEGFAGSFLGWLCQIAADENSELSERIVSRLRDPQGAYLEYVMSWKKARRFSEQLQELALDEIRLAEVDSLESPIDFIVRNLHFIHPMERVEHGGELIIELSPSRARYPVGLSPYDIGDVGGTIRLSPRVKSDFVAPADERTRERFQGDVQVLYQRLYREVALRVGYARSLIREARARAEQTVLREELHLLKNAFRGLWVREKALAEHLRDDPAATLTAVAEQRATYALCAFGLMLKQAARHESESPPPSGTIRLERLIATALPHAMLLVRELPREFVEGPFLADFTTMAERLAGTENLEERFWPSLLAADALAPAYQALVSAIASRGPALIWGDTGRCSLSGDARDFMHVYEILLEILLNAFKKNAKSLTLSHEGNHTLVIRSSNSDDLCAEGRQHSWKEVSENAVGGFALLRDRALALGGRYRYDRRSRVITTGGVSRDLFVRWDEIDLGRVSLQCEQSDHEAPSLSPSR